MTKAHALLVALVLVSASQANAQPHATMPIVVEADKVRIGAEYIPRRLDLPNQFLVAAGITRDLPTTGTYDYIEVAGTLRVSRTQDTAVVFTHLVILPGGTLDVGTIADPIACGRKVTLTIRNVPIDLTKDPFSWGNGLINFGKQTRIGCDKTPWVEASGSIAKGSTLVTVVGLMKNWAVGDEVLIPDTDKPVITGDGSKLNAVPSRRELPVFIESISGQTIKLSKALDFEHLNITDPNGIVVLRPRIANLTRNIKIQSENAATPLVGVRGHTVDIGMDATWDIRYNELVQLGRTTNTPLDDFIPTSGHLATNQRGKYAEHHHHVGSCPTCVDDGNVYRGHPLTTKWADVLHKTSDTLVRNNVGVDFPGAIFATEDGDEVRNTFDHNFGAYSMGIPGDPLGNPDDVHIKNNCPGCSGAGFWLHGVRNTFIGNEAWNNFRGIDFFNQQGNPGFYPSAPGVMPDTPFAPTDNRLMMPLSFDGNVTAANVNGGVEIWATHTFPNKNTISAYNAVQITGVLSDGIDHLIIHPTLICKPETGSLGIHAGQAYSKDFVLQGGGQIAGCAVGIDGGGGGNGLIINGPETLTLQNEEDINQVPHVLQHTNVKHLPFGAHPHKYITFGNVGRFSGPFWSADEPLPDVGDSDWREQTGSRWKVTNWQGTGKDYLLLHVQQLGSNPAWYSGPGPHGWNCPVKGLTMQGCWDQFGQSWGGDVLKDTEKVALDGVINAFGRLGFGVALSRPRAVVSFPTIREPALAHGEPNDLLVGFSALATGDLSTASDAFMISVNGAPAFNLRDYVTFAGSDRSFNAAVGAPGPKTIRVWLTQKANPTVPLAGSEMTIPFCVGPACATTVPGVKGLTVAYGSNAIVSAQLKVGPLPYATAPSDTVLVGRVLGTVPSAGTSVAQNSTVGLVLSSGPSATTTVLVPNVVGQMSSAAQAALTAAQLGLGTVANETNPAPLGQVIRQAPAQGTVVAITSAVDLVVSSGPAPPVCVAPQVLQNGVCVTPPPVCVPPNVLVAGACVPPPPPVCVPPKVLINGVCAAPTPPPSLFVMPSGTYTICDSATPPKCFTVVK